MIQLPSQDPFYDPAPVRGLPGDPIRVRRVALPLQERCRAWQVVYQSTGVLGRPVAMSGTLLVPASPAAGSGDRPVLAYGVGVHGLGRDAAPSHLLRVGTEPEQPAIEAALARGWVVVVPDGEGLGMPGPHTYGAGEPGGHALLDLVRAARVLTPEASTASPVLLWGYSEGGRCAAFAAESAALYAPELDVVAVAAGGVPADLRAVARAIGQGPFAGLALAVLIGLATAYDDDRLWHILTEEGRKTARRAADCDVVGLVLEHGRPLTELTVREEPWDSPRWREVLSRELAGTRAPSAPAYLYHCGDDEIVPVPVGRALASAWIARGGEVTWSDVDAESHLAGGLAGMPDALAWLSARLETRSSFEARLAR
ncbi:lipase family protein [Nocardioides sp. GXZ039]|uniref:lipase family protein n=1 Tax=Nocardioides sp. GXZ039 TaxID=3136018 RepID=UPI0030F46172